MGPKNRIYLVAFLTILLPILASCNVEVATPVDDTILPQTTITQPTPEIPSTKALVLSDESLELELLERIGLLEQQLENTQQTQNNALNNNKMQPDPTISISPNNETSSNTTAYDSNLNGELEPPKKITILNYSSYQTEDINRWVSYAESKMETRKSNILGWIYPVGDMISPEQEVEGMPFLKHEVMLKDHEINALMTDIESWLTADDCMGSRSRRDHLEEELSRFKAWFEEGADASTQAALCEETRIVAMGIPKQMRESEPLTVFQNFLIHEFYHAFQQDLGMEGQCERKKRQSGSNTQWFVEGGAQYFSQKVVAEIHGADYPFHSAWDRMLEEAWEVHNREGVKEIDGGPSDKSGAIGLHLLIQKGLLTEAEIMDGSLFHACARELVYDKNSPEIQHIRNSWYLIEKEGNKYTLRQEAYIP